MKNMLKLISMAALFVVACGDNKETPDARVHGDGKPADAYCSDCPAAPTLGAQLDRIGRPAINTVLNHGFDPTAAAATAKNAYNADGNVAGWQTAYTAEFMKNMAILDALDSNDCGNGKCEATETNLSCTADCGNTPITGTGNGCGNAVLYNLGQGGAPAADSYLGLSSVMADDELYLNPGAGECTFYLAVEFEKVVLGHDPTTCGGRTPQYDVIDYSLSVLAAGVGGLTVELLPRYTDGVGPHDDYLTDFPFLGEPH